VSQFDFIRDRRRGRVAVELTVVSAFDIRKTSQYLYVEEPRKSQYEQEQEMRMTIEVPFPDTLFAALRKAPHEVGREIRIAASIHWYQQSAISMERAAELAGMSRPEFLAELARRHVDVFVVEKENVEAKLDGDDDESVPPVWESIVRLGDSVPPEEWERVPNDLAANVDRYLYGDTSEDQ